MKYETLMILIIVFFMVLSNIAINENTQEIKELKQLVKEQELFIENQMELNTLQSENNELQGKLIKGILGVDYD